MKKLFALFLALTMVFSLVACGGNSAEETEGVPAQEMPASALEILENVWAEYGEDEKFPIIGGNIEANIMDAPGAVDMAYAGHLNWNLLVPEDKTADVAEAASMIHMMNANTFTGAAYKLADGVTAADFGAAMKEAVLNNQWLCGFPERLLIRGFGDSYVVVAFGVNDAMTPFDTHLSAAYPGMETIADEAIG